MKYRAELDGLRFIAVVPVVLYHADLELLSGGFLGVDVFFVISGYLIGSLLYEETQKGHFSVINFIVHFNALKLETIILLGISLYPNF